MPTPWLLHQSLLGSICLLALLGGAAKAEQALSLYEAFLNDSAAGRETLLPDYSYAGYHRCEKPLPDVGSTTHKQFNVVDYGATANDGASDRDAALATLDAAHAHPGPAVVFFPPGRYLLNEATDLGKPPLQIKRSNIVLKGSGVARTHLRFSEAPLLGTPCLLIRSSSGKHPDYWRGDKRLPGTVLEKLDAFRLRVSDTSGLAPGVRVNLNATFDGNQDSSSDYFAPHEVPAGILQRNAGQNNDIFELHEVQLVEDDVVTFRAPVHLDIPYFKEIHLQQILNEVEECGIEDLSLVGGFRQQFKHHNGSRRGEDYRMIQVDRAFNCWVRRVRITNYSQAISTWLCGFNTFRDILLEGNAGHGSVSVHSSYGNLFAYVRENTDTHHGLGVARSACNTVFLRCVQYASMEAHGGFPRSTLYDCNEGRFTPRGGGAKFYPHHDKGLTFWNWRVTAPGSYDFWPDGSRYGYFMPPIIAGLHGTYFEIADRESDLLAFESPRQPTNPDSLFESQLGSRLGGVPPWLTQSSESFESISRHSRIEIVSPRNYSRLRPETAAKIRLRVPSDLDREHLARVDLYASDSSLWSGFKRIRQAGEKSLTVSFDPPNPGVWVLRALLTNTRGEVTMSPPATLYFGSPREAEPIAVEASTMIPGRAKVKLYQDFVQQGGGEAAQLPGSKTLRKNVDQSSLHLFEKEYHDELNAFYASYGLSSMRSVVEDPEHVKLASGLFDGDTETAVGSLYSSDTLVQASFSEPAFVNRLDIHWGSKAFNKPVRLELQTSTDYPACWTSVVNDEPLWESSVCRVGGTLTKQVLHSKSRVTTLYFPATEAKAVRLLLGSFPNDGVTELIFYGVTPEARRP